MEDQFTGDLMSPSFQVKEDPLDRPITLKNSFKQPLIVFTEPAPLQTFHGANTAYISENNIKNTGQALGALGDRSSGIYLTDEILFAEVYNNTFVTDLTSFWAQF